VRWLLFYCYPWTASEDLQRQGVEEFLRHPEAAYGEWVESAQGLLRLRAEVLEQVVLVHWETAVAYPERVTGLLESRWGLQFDLSFGDAGPAWRIDGEDPLIDLVAATYPEAVQILKELDGVADLSSAGSWAAQPFRTSCRRPDDGGEPPALSFVMPCHDDGPFLIEAAASVERVARGGFPVEAVVVNDGSTDLQTSAILQGLRDAGLYVIDQENQGLSAARNRGIREARGRYLLPLDADNRILPDHPARAVKVLDERPDVSVVYSYWWEFGGRNDLRQPPEFDFGQLLRANYIDACAVFRRDVWEEVGGYDEQMRFWEDWEFWIRAAACGHRFHRIEEPGFEYRVRPGSLVELTLDRSRHEAATAYIAGKHRALYEERVVWLASMQHGEITFLLLERERLDREVAEARQELAQVEERFADLEVWARREITALRGALQALEADTGCEVDELRRTVPAIRGSVGWRLLNRWWALRLKLLPDNAWASGLYRFLRRQVEAWLGR
jgi:hypothetical protein